MMGAASFTSFPLLVRFLLSPPCQAGSQARPATDNPRDYWVFPAPIIPDYARRVKLRYAGKREVMISVE
jgi:hypothetical protein